MHSPFGWHYQCCKTFGWTLHEVLWKVPKAQIMLMMADQPGFVNTEDLIITKKGDKKSLDDMFGA